LHPYYEILQYKKKKIITADVTFFVDVFSTTAWAFFSKIKSDLDYIFFIFFLALQPNVGYGLVHEVS
jgi:hypothetical protein